MDIGEYLVVVGPCWIAEVDGGRAWVEFRDEQATEMDGACAGDCLYAAGALFGESWGISAQDQLCCARGEGLETGNGEVFVVEGGV